MPTDDVATIAKGLTKAQRDGVLHGHCGVPRGKEENAADCICGHPECENLLKMGLAYPRAPYPGGVVLSAKGISVRNHLMEQEHD